MVGWASGYYNRKALFWAQTALLSTLSPTVLSKYSCGLQKNKKQTKKKKNNPTKKQSFRPTRRRRMGRCFMYYDDRLRLPPSIRAAPHAYFDHKIAAWRSPLLFNTVPTITTRHA